MNEELRKITGVLINKDAELIEINQACESLYSFFCGLSFIESTRDKTPVSPKSGRPLKPEVAALCIKDVIRTSKTIRGIYYAIKDKLHENKKPVKILYAGCGPFATLVTPLTSFFSPEEIQLLLLEIHPDSVQLLKRVIHDLNISAYMHDTIATDAITFTIPKDFQPDIIVSETMNAALMCEPQVAIMANLFSQVTETTIMIPQKINVDLCLYTGRDLGESEMVKLGTLINFTDETARIISNDPQSIPVLNEGITLPIPQADPSYTSLILRTLITIYDDVEIGFNESGLTIPVLQMIRNPGDSSFPPALNFKYVMGRLPEFIYRTIK
jgi:hypothetical protein